MLLHVVDISHSNFEEQIEVVNQTLQEIDALDKPTFVVFNKIDAYKFILKDEDDLTPMTKENFSLEELKKTWMNKTNDLAIFISAKEKANINEFKELTHAARYPYDKFLY